MSVERILDRADIPVRVYESRMHLIYSMINSEGTKRAKRHYTFFTKAEDADSLSVVNSIEGISGK